jgi:hypothetical protein
LLGQFRFGTAPRNSVIGPSLVAVDFSLVRILRLSERQTLQTEAQVFNILNHPNFDVPVRIFDSTNFGARSIPPMPTGTARPARSKVALRYRF